jgi:hypothetical protein
VSVIQVQPANSHHPGCKQQGPIGLDGPHDTAVIKALFSAASCHVMGNPVSHSFGSIRGIYAVRPNDDLLRRGYIRDNICQRCWISTNHLCETRGNMLNRISHFSGRDVAYGIAIHDSFHGSRGGTRMARHTYPLALAIRDAICD